MADLGDRELDGLFLRYRDGGEVEALGALFDALAPELYRLGARLAATPDGADDLVQATFLTAIRRADRYDATRPVAPWLFGLLATHAARMRRSEGRRPDPQRLADEPVEDPTDVVSRDELRAAVERAVASLPERYRPVVAGAVLDGRPPTELAGELNRSPGTVRVQLHRGLALLRRVLPPSLATAVVGRLAPTGSADALASVRAAVLAEARTAALVGAAHPATPIVGALLVNKVLVGALAAVAVLVAVVVAVREESNGRASVATEATGAPPAESAQVRGASSEPGSRESTAGAELVVATATPERELAVVEAPPPSHRLLGTVTGLDPRSLAAARVVVQGWSAGAETGDAAELPLSTVDGEAPRFELDLTDWVREGGPDRINVTLADEVHRADVVAVALESEARTYTVELDATAQAVIRLRLVDEDGEPLTNHYAALYPFPEGSEAPLDDQLLRIRSDGDGRVRMTVESSGRFALVSAAWKRRPATRIVELSPGAAIELGDVALDRGETVTGVAWRGDEHQPSGTLVVARLDGAEDNYMLSVGNQSLQMDWVEEAFEHIHCANLVTENGQFELLGMAPRPYSVVPHVLRGDVEPAPIPIFPSLDGLQVRDRGARLRLAVPAGFDETDLFGVQVTAEDSAAFARRWDPIHERVFEIVVQPEVPVAMRVYSDDGHDLEFTLIAPPAGEALEYELELADGPHGDVILVAPEEPALAGIEVTYWARRSDGLRRGERVTMPAEGELRIDALPAGEWTVEVEPINAVEPTTLFPSFTVTVEDGDELRMPIPAAGAGEVPVRVRSADGTPISAKVVRVDGEVESAVTVEAQFGGVRSIRYGNGALPASLERAVLLPPGAHRLRFSADGHRSRVVEVEVRAGVRGASLEVALDREPD